MSSVHFKLCRLLYLGVALTIACPCGSRAADPGSVKQQIDALTSALSSEVASDASVEKALIGLLEKIAGTDCRADHVLNISCKTDQIKAYAGALAPAFTMHPAGEQQAALWDALKPLLSISPPGENTSFVQAMRFAGTQLDGKTAAADPNAAIAELSAVTVSSATAVTLANPLQTLPPNKLETMAKAALAAEKAMGQLYAALPQAPRINILDAWYGDVHAIAADGGRHIWRQSDRFCSALRVIRSRCQGKPACFSQDPNDPTKAGPQDDGTAADITGSVLCGYDPAPFADSIDRALMISYECLSADPATWRSIGTDDPDAPGALSRDHDHNPRYAMLRASMTGELRCQGFFK